MNRSNRASADMMTSGGREKAPVSPRWKDASSHQCAQWIVVMSICRSILDKNGGRLMSLQLMNHNLRCLYYSGCKRKRRRRRNKRMQGNNSKFILYTFLNKAIFDLWFFLDCSLFLVLCIYLSDPRPPFNLLSGGPRLWLWHQRSKRRQRSGGSRSKILRANYFIPIHISASLYDFAYIWNVAVSRNRHVLCYSTVAPYLPPWRWDDSPHLFALKGHQDHFGNSLGNRRTSRGQ